MKKIILATIICAIFAGTAIHNHNRKTEWENNCEVDTIVVHSGDTLYDIANQYKPSWMDANEYISYIEELNNMTTADICTNDVLNIYVGGNN